MQSSSEGYGFGRRIGAGVEIAAPASGARRRPQARPRPPRAASRSAHPSGPIDARTPLSGARGPPAFRTFTRALGRLRADSSVCESDRIAELAMRVGLGYPATQRSPGPRVRASRGNGIVMGARHGASRWSGPAREVGGLAVALASVARVAREGQVTELVGQSWAERDGHQVVNLNRVPRSARCLRIQSLRAPVAHVLPFSDQSHP